MTRGSAGIPLKDEHPKLSPLGPISQLVISYRCAKLLFVAAKLDLFTRLSRGDRSAEDISRELGFNFRAACIFLDALAAMGFLIKTGSSYANSEMSARFLVRGKRGFVGDNLEYQDFIWDSWSELETVLSAGVPSEPLDVRLKGQQEFLGKYIRGMSDIAEAPAKEIAGILGPLGAASLLDIGGGAGKYTLTLAALNPQLKAAILDLPGTLSIAREFVNAAPCRDRIQLIAGNYHRTELGRGKYDLILISHVTHHEGDPFNQLLLRRCHTALRPGGRLVVHDFMTDDARTAPLFSAVFSAHMLVSTREGRTYSAGDYESWMKEAGFKRTARKVICAGSETPTQVVIGSKG